MRPFFIILILIISLFFSCKNTDEPLVNTQFTDSLIAHYSESTLEKIIRSDMAFWKNRLDTTPDSYTALSRYAGGLVQQFHLYGDMGALLRADSILTQVNTAYHEKEAGTLRSLASLAITRHRFKDADVYVQKALAIGSDKYASTLLYFDTQFELGHYTLANQALRSCLSTNEYGYFFRLSKWKHLDGETDSAVYYLQKAADWAGSSAYLQQTAFSNIADLYLHEGELKKSNQLYTKNLCDNASDLHSLQGLGRIALMGDNNTVAAEKIFRFIASKNSLPDAIYNLEWVAEQREDTAMQRRMAAEFANKASGEIYGGMYNRYLVELYTGILASPVKALNIAEKELENRATPQTFAWYAWCLHRAGLDKKAMEVFKLNVSGKPLEALELFWMGKMMKDTGKGYNAEEFFKAAAKNRYDLSPLKQKELKSLL